MSGRKDHIRLVPQEILTYNIFIRLPVKSLGCCKCVLKSWNSLISDPHFIKTHLTKTSKENATTSVILISTKLDPGSLHSVHVDMSNSYFPICFKFGPQLVFDCSNTWSQIWGSCDGLILAEDNRTWTSMYLLNPTTRESKRLPLVPCGTRKSCVFGFGYDSSCNDYAVVAIAYRRDSFKKNACVYVYMLNTNKWNKVGLSPYDHKCNNPVAGLFVGGCLHWLAKNVDDSSMLVSVFDIANKKFSQVPVPKEFSNGVELGVVKGCLCMIDNVNGHMTELWIMNDYGVFESWVKFSTSPGVSVSWVEDTCAVLECGTVVLLVTNARQGRFNIYKRCFHSQTDIEVGVTYVNSIVSPNIKEKDEKQKKKIERRSNTIK